MTQAKQQRRMSEQGLLRIPKNPHQRQALAKPKGALEKYNETREDLTSKGSMKQTHPTKGPRVVSIKRARAQAAMAAIMANQPGAANLATMKDFMQNG